LYFEQKLNYLKKNDFTRILINVSRQFLSFISSCIKRNSYERPNYHHIVKISGIQKHESLE